MGLEAGDKLGPYEVKRLLGTGGMGEVYRARDPRLGRDVAIKILPDEIADRNRLSRFEQEARAAGALNHPNVLAVYDVGTEDSTPYVVSELLEGETLRARLDGGAMPERQALDFALQIVHGLAAAHDKGIVHRDLKPENVFVTEDGRVKILDFGLAKLMRPEDSDPSEEQTVTAAGTVLGTVGYMSPEQVRGVEVDHRCDLFSFGAVLFEMLSGQRAFRRDTAVETMNAILTEDAPAASSSPGLASIVGRCLDKNPDRRFQSTRDLALALEAASSGASSHPLPKPVSGAGATHRGWTLRRGRALAAGLAMMVLFGVGVYFYGARVAPRPPLGTPVVTSVAVFPFENASGDPDVEYLADGVAESLINRLARLSSLKVMARTTSFRFKGTEIDAWQAGRELGVGAVLTGRVSLRGETLVVGAELIDVAEGTLIWGERYDRSVSDLLTVQASIASEIANQLHVTLSREERRELTGRETRSASAYDLYLKGLHQANRVDLVSLDNAKEYFERAIEADPAYALPHVGLANIYSTIGYMAMAPPQVIWPMVKTEATRALELDDRLAAAHAALGHAILFYDWDFPAAKRSLDRALQLDPEYAPTHHWLAHYWMTMGDMELGLAESRRAVELAPLDMLIRGHELYFLAATRRRDELLERRRQAAEVNPDHWVLSTAQGLAYLLEGKLPGAISELERADARSSGVSLTLMDLGYAYGLAGQNDKAFETIAELNDRAARQHYSVSVQTGVIHGSLGEKDRAFELLETGFAEHNPFLLFLSADWYWFDGIRDDPRYADLIRRVGLP